MPIWLYDPNLKYGSPDVYRQIYDGRILFAEHDRDEGVMYYNYLDSERQSHPKN